MDTRDEMQAILEGEVLAPTQDALFIKLVTLVDKMMDAGKVGPGALQLAQKIEQLASKSSLNKSALFKVKDAVDNFRSAVSGFQKAIQVLSDEYDALNSEMTKHRK